MQLSGAGNAAHKNGWEAMRWEGLYYLDHKLQSSILKYCIHGIEVFGRNGTVQT